MGLSVTSKNAMLDAWAALVTHVGLANGATELTGGSPAYARQAVSWAAASGGAVALAGPETFDVPAGSTVNRVILRGHITNASPDYGYGALTAEVFGGQGTYTLDSLQVELQDP